MIAILDDMTTKICDTAILILIASLFLASVPGVNAQADAPPGRQPGSLASIKGQGAFPRHAGRGDLYRAPAGDPGSINIEPSLGVTDSLSSCVHLPLVMHGYAPPSPTLYPDDPFYDQEWALEKIGAPKAWGLSTGADTVIAVLDTGADLDHPDLGSKVLTDRDWDFVNDDDVADDDHGHGTHASGIAAAATDNGTGVAGLG